MTDPRSLTRPSDGRPSAPVRSVHLGLGNFFRAHQCWYTEHATDADRWGIAAFSGTSHGDPSRLNDQDDVYTLLVRGAESDAPEVISSVVEAHAASESKVWRELFARPELAFVSTTVTEAGYCRNTDGGLDTDDPAVAADLRALQTDGLDAAVRTAPARIVLGLLARRAAGYGDFTVLPCDNVPGNGAMLHRVVSDAAAAVDPHLRAWIDEHVSFVTTMVDRITPRATDADRADLRTATGVDDPEVVITEPYTEWVLSGKFPGGRPEWEAAGARFVDDIEPWEQRKLWLLNGSHSLMAYAATILGHETVADAIGDERVRGWVEQWWDEACRHLPLEQSELADYRSALIERFRNPNIRHLLSQIAADGSQKVPIRAIPVVRAELADGRDARGGLRIVAAWIAHLRGHGAPVQDGGADDVSALAQGDLDESVPRVLGRLGIDDPQAASTVRDLLQDTGVRSESDA